MALIKCPECGKENVSDSASACPSCGYNIKEHFDVLKTQLEKQENIGSSVQNKSVSKGLKVVMALFCVVILFVLIYFNHLNQEKEKIEEYKINLAAQTCSINNRTNAIIEQIESMSSFEWFMSYAIEQGRTQEDAFETYSGACLNALTVKCGIDNLEPIEYWGDETSLCDTYKYYCDMYDSYNDFYVLIENPYLPAEDYINEVYAKAEAISSLYMQIQDSYKTPNLEEYAIKQGQYYMYYKNK